MSGVRIKAGTGGDHIARPTSSFRQSMAGLHTWVGLLPGWLLFIIFLFGTTAYFQEEISRWMRPELRGATPTAQALVVAQALLEREAPDAARWTVSLPTGRDGKPLRVSWRPREGAGKAGSATLDERTGEEITIRDTNGGFFLYRFHFELSHIPAHWARLIVWTATLAMLVGIVSGIVTHKKIFADFFLLRLGKGQRSWLDAHNVTGVLALPFHLMITYTGLCAMLFTLMPWSISANFPSEAAFDAQRYPDAPAREWTGQSAAVAPFAQIIAAVEQASGGSAPSFFTIDDPGDVAAIVTARPRHDRIGSMRNSIYLSGTTGGLLVLSPAEGAVSVTQTVMIDLHTGMFARPVLRWLYFLSGVLGTVMIGTGLLLWIVKRRTRLPDPQYPPFGFRLVERLNIGMMIGPLAGTASYFLANRLLPLQWADRANWEIRMFFLCWGVVILWSLIRPARRAWIETIGATAALFLLVPLANSLTTSRGLMRSLTAGDWVYVSFDLVMILTSAALFLALWRLVTRKDKALRRRACAIRAALT